jgi:uncharacterized membrane protein
MNGKQVAAGVRCAHHQPTEGACRTVRPASVVAGYAVTALVFLLLDGIWLSTMASRLYQPALGHLVAPQFALLPAAIFYPLYVAGVVYFALVPALQAGRARVALVRGAALGLLAYATYDLTNQSTLRDWPWLVTLVDLAWGAFVTSCAATVAAAVLLRRRVANSH